MRYLLFSICITTIVNAKCTVQIDNPTYQYNSISYNLYDAILPALLSKGYIASQRFSPYRSNIKIRIISRRGYTPRLDTFFNLYNYRKHLIHLYRYKVCLSAQCSRVEISNAIDNISLEAAKELVECK